ncbi:trehalose-phosphatase [Microbacterium capsulatum]|uniref:Trehalose 6-phosphate phosphatase n=1 Tax=Microbacterium capsulatum TaxID=3041921 RepID=A0ABU0XC12_9MICO|nr:trehalose-phosphatase [Microbacterium sp. ASV81]MDQ4212497.1 trehalose-phosphatase [Microbacterium sp. ASV81]
MTRDWIPGAPDEALAALARTPRLLVALDFDGTVSPHVSDPMTARALPDAVRAVARLSALPGTSVAYVSGRSLHDLREIAEHDDASPVLLAGSHGAQYWFPDTGEETDLSTAPADRAEVIDELRTLIADLDGVVYEPKTFGFGVHTRTAAPGQEELAFIRVEKWAPRRIPSWRRRTGHHLREFSWRDEGKDVALARLRGHVDATAVLFAGDDVTDEDGMRALGSEDLGVRIGGGDTAAALRVADPAQLAGFLSALADLRAASPGGGPAAPEAAGQ